MNVCVVDSNIFLSHLNKWINIQGILKSNIYIRIHAIIVEEVLRNTNEAEKKDFFKLLCGDNIQISNDKFPSRLLDKYRKLGFKKGDILIASFCESIKADYLITENRHFLKSKIKKFDVMNFNEFCNKYFMKFSEEEESHPEFW